MIVPKLNPRLWPGLGIQPPGREENLAPDGDMSAAGVDDWVQGSAALLSKVETAHGRALRIEDEGSSGNIYAVQTIGLVSGRLYRFRGRAAGDGVNYPRLYNGGSFFWNGEVGTEPQEFNVLRVASNVQYRIYSSDFNTGNAALMYEIHVEEVPAKLYLLDADPLYLDPIQAAHLSAVDETSGQLSDTGYTILSGSWRVKADASEQWIECVAAGKLLRPAPLRAKDCTWSLDVWRGGPSSNTNVQIVTATTAAVNDASQTGWRVGMSGGERVQLLRSLAGAQQNTMLTAADYLPASEGRYGLHLTKSAGDVFSYYLKGGPHADWSLLDLTGGAGVNPSVAETVGPTSAWVVWDLSANDRIYHDRHYAGVIEP